MISAVACNRRRLSLPPSKGRPSRGPPFHLPLFSSAEPPPGGGAAHRPAGEQADENPPPFISHSCSSTGGKQGRPAASRALFSPFLSGGGGRPSPIFPLPDSNAKHCPATLSPTSNYGKTCSLIPYSIPLRRQVTDPCFIPSSFDGRGLSPTENEPMARK